MPSNRTAFYGTHEPGQTPSFDHLVMMTTAAMSIDKINNMDFLSSCIWNGENGGNTKGILWKGRKKKARKSVETKN